MSSRTRVALYSHDTVGLGHARRCLALAEALTVADAGVDVLLITGNPEAALLPRPERTDLLALPSIGKDADGAYRPGRLGSALGDVVRLRSEVIATSLRAFDPQLLIVDKVADGLGGELVPALRALTRTGRTRIVLGLREVLDSPSVVRREWKQSRTPALIARHYDEVWVYGDVEVYDPVAEYGWSGDVAAKVRHLGYLRTSGRADRRTGAHAAVPPSEPYVLCQVGGGADGFAVAEAFVRTSIPTDHRGVLLTGPYLSPERRERLRDLAPAHIEVHEFVDNPEEFVSSAAAIVSMAGYNSTVEVLATGTPVLTVPRVLPRAEQLIRAERLARLGHLDLLPPEQLTAARLAGWLAGAVHRTVDRGDLDLHASRRIAPMAFRLISGAEHVA